MAERPPAPRPGDVVLYAYLWGREARAGAEEARKERPCAVVLAATTVGDRVQVVVAPVTSRAPKVAEEGVEIPAAVRRRLGLQEAPCWIVLTEVNRFVWPGPDLRPVRVGGVSAWAYGVLPLALLRQVRDAIVERARSRRLRAVPREE